MQGMTGKLDIVMGSFSKTFGSNGGFVATHSPAVREYLKFYGCSQTFSNALSPVQCASVLKAFDIIQSVEGKALRETMMARVLYLREQLQQAGFEVMGDPSAIVPVLVGPEALARIVCQKLPAQGIVLNLVEYPAVAKGNARLRLQVMASHTKEHIDTLIVGLVKACEAAKAEYQDYCDDVAAPPVLRASA
jgi:glycine C-acetyltransferase